MKLGQIIVPKQEDQEYLLNFISKYPIQIRQDFPDVYDIDTKVVGWEHVKEKWPKQNIFDKDISKNISWTYSITEDEKGLQEDIQSFVDKCIKKWLPSEFILLDWLDDKEIPNNFLKKVIDSQEKVYVNIYKNAIYLYFQGKNYILNLNSLSILYDDYKVILTRFLGKANSICLSAKNVFKYVYLDEIEYLHTFENAYWVKYSKELSKRYFQIIPGINIERYIPFMMNELDKFEFDEYERDSLKRAFIRCRVTEWLSNRYICFREDFSREGLDFVYRKKHKFAKIDYSDKRTVTGRITATSSYNPQSLDKKTNARKDIVSRFTGGKIVVYDYTSFESRIALYMCGDEDFIHKYQYKDLHFEIARIIFGEQHNITDDDREFAKIINHSILYGASQKSIFDKLMFTKNADIIYKKILNFLTPLLKKNEEINQFFRANGYIINPYKSIIRPNKDYAAFNNFIQSTATEILIEKILELRKFLDSYRSELLFQVHDSIVFDIHPEESEIINEIAKILMKIDNMIFTLDYKYGTNYKELSPPVKIISY